MIIDRALDPPGNPSKPPKVGHDQKGHDTKRDALRTVLPPRRENTVINDVGKHQYREIQRREVVMDIGYPAHDKERHVMQEPAIKRNLAHVQKVTPAMRVHVSVFTLLTEQVKSQQQEGPNNARRTTPPDDRCS